MLMGVLGVELVPSVRVIDARHRFDFDSQHLACSLAGNKTFSCQFGGNCVSVRRIASMTPVQHVEDGQSLLKGESFIRPHLRNLSPYQPILPFEVLSLH